MVPFGLGFATSRRDYGSGPPFGPGESPRQRLEDRTPLGLLIFLVSLGVMFAAAIAGFSLLLLRRGHGQLEFRLPWQLWAAGAAAVSAPLALARARHWLRRDARRARLALGIAVVAATSLVLLQVLALTTVQARHPVFEVREFGLLAFYALVGLHVMHSIVGVTALLWAIGRGLGLGRNRGALGLGLCAMYQRFLALTWIAVLVTLQLQQALR